MKWNENVKQIMDDIENSDLEQFVKDNVHFTDSNVSPKLRKRQRNVVTIGYTSVAQDKAGLSVPDRLMLLRLFDPEAPVKRRTRMQNRRLRRIRNKKLLSKEVLIYKN